MNIASRYDLPGKLAPVIHISAALRSMFGANTTACTYEQRHTSDGKSIMRWYAVKEPSECRMLSLGLTKKRPTNDHRRRVDLFPTILRALRIRELMPVWAAGGNLYEILKEREPAICGPCVGIPAHLWDLAACAIACGHPAQPRMSGGAPYVQERNHDGVSIREDLAPVEVELRNRYTAGHLARAITIPGYPAEEHPYFYCRQAINHLADCHAAEAAARKNPTGLFKGKFNRSAIVSLSVATQHEGILKRHLSGMPI